MICKITNPNEFIVLIRQLEETFQDQNGKYGHWGEKICADSLIKAWADSRLLNFHLHVWANKEGEKYDAVIMFQGVENFVINKKLWQEYLWISNNPSVSMKLLRTALKFGRELGFKKVVLNRVINHPNSERLVKFYERMGWKKDSESFLGQI